jgi:hypothetical protein
LPIAECQLPIGKSGERPLKLATGKSASGKRQIGKRQAASGKLATGKLAIGNRQLAMISGARDDISSRVR